VDGSFRSTWECFISQPQTGGETHRLSRQRDRNHRVPDMAKQFSALLVYEREGPIRSLEANISSQGVRTLRSRNCSEVREVLREMEPPDLIMTDVSLPDGTWEDVLSSANSVPATVPVIVVSHIVEMALYLDVLQSGAYDFIVPPISFWDLAYIIRGALLKRWS